MPDGARVRWTPEQEAAITLSGRDVLVSAAAGAGKTSVLVERVIRRVIDPERPLDLGRLLAVTFTEKAAAEMKQRIRASLEEALTRFPENQRLLRQASLLDKAQISTIHSFCLHVVRRYFYKAELDPSFRVLDQRESELILQDALDELLEELYGDEGEYGQALRSLVDRYGGRGVDEDLRQALVRLYGFARSQASMDDWLEAARNSARCSGVSDAVSSPWMKTLLWSAVRDLERARSRVFRALSLSNEPDGPKAYSKALQADAGFFEELVSALAPEACVGGSECGAEAGVDPRRIEAAADLARSFVFPRLPGKVGNECDPAKRELAKRLRGEAKALLAKVNGYAFMRSLEEVAREVSSTSAFVDVLVRLVRDLDRKYAGKKRDRGGLDFADLERYCLTILESDGGRVAEEIRSEFDCVVIDEYQDVNPLQERIMSLVSCQDPGSGNRFMVGDMKQSIYRFRLAEPRIFLRRLEEFQRHDAGSEARGGAKVHLPHNFRSRCEVIHAVNHVFRRVMKRDVAEVDYDSEHELRPAAEYPEAPSGAYVTELHLIERVAPGDRPGTGDGSREQTGPHEAGEGDEAGVSGSIGAGPDAGEGGEGRDELEEYEALEKEALVVASRIAQLVDSASPFMLWDSRTGAYRPCAFRDIAVLMRSTKERANAVLEIFQKCGIPAYADTGTGYFQAREVEVALSLLSVIDNPRQDIPLAAVLRSPIVGLTPADLARIRASHKGEDFYCAVRRFARDFGECGKARGEAECSAEAESQPQSQSHSQRIAKTLVKFFQDLGRWRTMARRSPLAELLWTVLRETGYLDYVGGLPGGAQRQANLRALCDRAREFDSYGRHGLFRFMRFIEKIQETEGDLGTARALGEREDVVRVMSVHKAKGLEFPVVFVLDLGKEFNMEDVRQDILFHRDLGIGVVYCDLEHRIKYPTALHQAVSLELKRESLAEEMRVLYVAMTRAKEKLILVGSARELPKHLDRWKFGEPEAARTCLDWICPAVLASSEEAEAPFQVRFWGTADGLEVPEPPARSAAPEDPVWRCVRELRVPPPGRHDIYGEVRRRLEWEYPRSRLATTFAKITVGEVRRRIEEEETDSWTAAPESPARLSLPGRAPGEASSAISRGIAIHSLLARIPLDKACSADAVRQEAEKLVEQGFIERPGVTEEDLHLVAAFFETSTGLLLRQRPERVRREVPFTMRLPAHLFMDPAGPSPDLADFVVVQGVIDVLVDEGDRLRILDYKTDACREDALRSKAAAYAPQVSLYALAAERILKKPVETAELVFLSCSRVIPIDWRTYLKTRGFEL